MSCEECKKSINRPCNSCNSCGNTPKVIQIDNPAEVVMFHKVIVPASMGDESVTPATNGLYKNTLLVYQANGHAFLYSSDGIPTRISFDSGAVLFVDRLPEVEQATTGYLYIDENGNAAITMDNENWVKISGGEGTTDFEMLINRPKYAGEFMDRNTDIPDVTEAVAAEANLRIQEDNSLSLQISEEAATRAQADNSLSTEIANEIRNRTDEDASLQTQIDSLDSELSAEQIARFESFSELEEKLETEKTARESADSDLDAKISAEQTARFEAISDVEEKISAEETARTNADTAIEDKIDTNVITDISIDTTASTTVVKLSESKVNLKTGVSSPDETVLPVASKTQAGVMNAATFEAVEENSNDIASLLSGAVMTDKLVENPNQAQILAAWQLASGLTEPKNSASIWDTVYSKKYTYFANQNQWVLTQDGMGGTTVTVEQWSNTKAGIIKGSTNDGQLFAESDGTGSVNGWDDVKSNATVALEKATNNEQVIAGKEDKLPESGTTSQYLRGDKTWQTLDKAAVGLGNVDNTSDANKPVSTAVATELAKKQDTLTAGDGIKIENNVITNTKDDIEWGKITGRLSDQTDLQDELDKKIEAEDPVDTEAVEAVVSTDMIQNGAVIASKLGDDVPMIYNGTEEPSPELGKDGDIYIQYSE